MKRSTMSIDGCCDENSDRKRLKHKPHLAINAKLARPEGIFVSPTNEVYITDTCNHSIRKILNDGTIVTIAGNGTPGFSGDFGLATIAQLSYPDSVYVSKNNEVYIADSNNNRIRKILQNGIIVTVAGTGGENGGDEIPAVKAQLNYPTGVFVSSNNEVYFCELKGHVVRKILKNGIIITIAGNGIAGFSGDYGPAIHAQLNHPASISVSSNNEVYIADKQNHRIRKILPNGYIITIVGNGQDPSPYFGGIDPNELSLNEPTGVSISKYNEIYVSDSNNHTIRKINKELFPMTDNIDTGSLLSLFHIDTSGLFPVKYQTMETIAGNGTPGFSNGDYGSARSAMLNYPIAVFAHNYNHIYIADALNNRIRKITNGIKIETIAGTGEEGYSQDAPFDISLYPHFGNINKVKFSEKLKKHSRDEIFGLDIIGFIPLIEKLSPHFCNIILKDEKVLTIMKKYSQLENIQKMIEYLIYHPDQDLDLDSNALLVLGLFENGEFIGTKETISWKSCDSRQFIEKWEQIQHFLKICKEELNIQSNILEKVNTYCVEYACMRIHLSKDIDPNLPIFIRNWSAISSCRTSQPTPFKIDEIIEIESKTVDSLYNEKESSDVRIKIGNDFIYCHKTILSSTSSFFSALFDSGASFSDLKDGIFTPDSSEDLELLEILLKYCYGIPPVNIEREKIISLLDLAMKHEIQYLIDFCKNSLNISVDNYFEIVEEFENYLNFPRCEIFFNELVEFGIENCKQLFSDYNRIAKLPEKLNHALIFTFSQRNN